MRIKTILLSLASTALLSFITVDLLAGGSPPPPPADESAADSNAGSAPFDLSDPVRIQRGRERFESTCASFCHGYQPPLFVGRVGLEPEYIHRTITEGGKGATPMPPWGGVFTPEEIWELTAYIKFLGTQKP